MIHILFKYEKPDLILLEINSLAVISVDLDYDFLRIISEFTDCGRFEIRWVYSHLVVCIYLIKRILISEKFVLGETNFVAVAQKSLFLFSFKILTPASRMIPMGTLKDILILLANPFDSVLICEIYKLSLIATIVTGSKLPNSEICLSHFFFFLGNVKHVFGLSFVVSESLLRK